MADILYYKSHLNSDFDKFKAICKSHDVNIIEVDEKEVDHLVGYLIGLEGFDETKKEVIDDKANIDFDFILFSNFDTQKMFDVIDELRNNKVNVQHKAGVTENNVQWSLRDLLIENDREARTMGLIHKINDQLEKASDLKEKYGEDAKTKALINEIKAFFKDSSIFSIDKAKDYYLKLLDENIRVENENE